MFLVGLGNPSQTEVGLYSREAQQPPAGSPPSPKSCSGKAARSPVLWACFKVRNRRKPSGKVQFLHHLESP